ncbi:hypothetical protein L249_2673 [Ophiocordyceps polyrhachis-furcata BCC 54312]|uniref:Uncharacterized protein n=1 Tax=Ophiocordyceps polyrhachis-furcata BCC 54312 TaxID=1330021 RepID=A0A367LSR0_9HYPO|nr:hypothetical protein L249_2673 [Ophiocordyceps polyrhachis-furcata BCC 54312]
MSPNPPSRTRNPLFYSPSPSPDSPSSIRPSSGPPPPTPLNHAPSSIIVLQPQSIEAKGKKKNPSLLCQVRCTYHLAHGYVERSPHMDIRQQLPVSRALEASWRQAVGASAPVLDHPARANHTLPSSLQRRTYVRDDLHLTLHNSPVTGTFKLVVLLVCCSVNDQYQALIDKEPSSLFTAISSLYQASDRKQTNRTLVYGYPTDLWLNPIGQPHHLVIAGLRNHRGTTVASSRPVVWPSFGSRSRATVTVRLRDAAMELGPQLTRKINVPKLAKMLHSTTSSINRTPMLIPGLSAMYKTTSPGQVPSNEWGLYICQSENIQANGRLDSWQTSRQEDKKTGSTQTHNHITAWQPPRKSTIRLVSGPKTDRPWTGGEGLAGEGYPLSRSMKTGTDKKGAGQPRAETGEGAAIASVEPEKALQDGQSFFFLSFQDEARRSRYDPLRRASVFGNACRSRNRHGEGERMLRLPSSSQYLVVNLGLGFWGKGGSGGGKGWQLAANFFTDMDMDTSIARQKPEPRLLRRGDIGDGYNASHVLGGRAKKLSSRIAPGGKCFRHRPLGGLASFASNGALALGSVVAATWQRVTIEARLRCWPDVMYSVGQGIRHGPSEGHSRVQQPSRKMGDDKRKFIHPDARPREQVAVDRLQCASLASLLQLDGPGIAGHVAANYEPDTDLVSGWMMGRVEYLGR